MGDRISIMNKPIIMSDTVIKEKIILDLARVENLNVLELENLVNLDGLEKYLVLSLGFEQHNLLNIGNLWKFTQLTKLQMANNLIEEIEGLELLSNLQFLDLSFNSIKYIKGLEDLLSLKYLNLSSNRIEVLENMESLKELETFLVRYNKISFDNIYFLAQFEKLLSLGIGENPLVFESDVRLHIIAILPQLKFLDFVMVTESELCIAFEKYPANIDNSTDIKARAKRTAGSKISIAPPLKISSNQPAFIEGLANGQGFEVLLKSDKNFYLLHSFPPASDISSNHRQKLTEIFDDWFTLGYSYYNQMQVEKEELMKMVNEAQDFACSIAQEEEYQYINFKEDIPKKLCYIYQKHTTSEQKDKEAEKLKEKWDKALLNSNRKLMNASCLCTDLIYKMSKVCKREMLKIKSKYLQDVENLYSEIMKVDEMCIKELMTFYANIFDTGINYSIETTDEHGQFIETDPTFLLLLKKKEYVETALQVTLLVHSTVLQERINGLRSSLDAFITETLNIILKGEFFLRRNEQTRNTVIFFNKQKYVMDAFFCKSTAFKNYLGYR